jgi:hypothetical protein
MAVIFRQRRDTAANWTTNNPVIPDGQLCFDTTNDTFRIGNGVANYLDLIIQLSSLNTKADIDALNIDADTLDTYHATGLPVSTPQLTALSLKQDTNKKDASGGYAGLTLFKINFKNAANTFTNFLTNATTAAREYAFPDKSGTVALTSDLIGTSVTNTPAGNIAATTVQAAINELDAEKAPIASPSLTGTPTAPTAAASTSTTQLATTAYALNEAALRYGKDNALGTVSQTAGVPTGALMEYGSNANGEYWKYAGGMLVCRHRSNTNTDGIYVWTYPAPSVDPSPHNAAMSALNVGETPTDLTFGFYSYTTTGVTFRKGTVGARGLHVMAIGRWY